MRPRATYRLARRDDNRVTACCTWCGATSPWLTDARVSRWKHEHTCKTETKEKP